MNRAQLAENPFFVLGVPVTATRVEVERAGQKLLAEMMLGTRASQTHASPFGPRKRDENDVRLALAALRNPAERVLHELWAEDTLPNAEAATAPGWDDALASIGWRGPCLE